jgi:transposase-like protein
VAARLCGEAKDGQILLDQCVNVAVTGVIPDRVTTDGHDGYPAAIQSEFGEDVLHRTSVYLNNRLEQDHRGIKDRYRPMRGFKSMASARRFCRTFDEVRNLLRVRSLQYHYVPADRRRLRYLRNTATILGILEAA